MHAAECFKWRTHLCELVLTVTRAKDYSYLKATIGSTRIARRAGDVASRERNVACAEPAVADGELGFRGRGPRGNGKR